MFKIKNNCLWYGGISFKLVDGLYLNTNTETSWENGIEFWPEDKSFYIVLKFEQYEDTAENYIKKIKLSYERGDEFLYKGKHPHLTPIKKIKLHNLDGYTFSYHDNAEVQFESIQENIHLAFYIHHTKEVMKCKEAQNLFNEIKIEKYE